jgi:soluble lytic murein transglycosylase-like protein
MRGRAAWNAGTPSWPAACWSGRPVLATAAAALIACTAAVLPEARYDAEIASAVESVREVYRVPVPLVKAVIAVESAWNPRARSRAGARGLMQVMPATAAKVAVRADDLFDPGANIVAGTRVLAVLLRHYRGDVVSALVAYNAGPRAPNAAVPQNGETPAYVWRVLSWVGEFSRRDARG